MSLFTNLIEQSKGRFITVTFVKKDGTLRTLNGRTGVRKYLKPSDTFSVQSEKQAQYITLYDVRNKGYRSVNRDTIKALKIDGVKIEIN